MVREHRKEARRQQKRQGEAADPAHGPLSGPEPAVAGDAVAENEDVGRADMHSYCCVDYTRTLDVAALRLFRLRRRLKEQVQDRSAFPAEHPFAHTDYLEVEPWVTPLSLQVVPGTIWLKRIARGVWQNMPGSCQDT